MNVLENASYNNDFCYYTGMSVKNIGDRGVQEILNRRKKLAILAVSVAGIIFGILLFFLGQQ